MATNSNDSDKPPAAIRMYHDRDPYTRDREKGIPSHGIKLHKKLAILKLVGSYGQLGEVELARAVWPESAPEISAKKAELSAIQLEAEGYVLRIKDASGSFSLILCPRGEASLRLEGIECHHGVRFQLGGRQFYRRRIATQYLVHRQVQGRNAHHESSLLIGKSRVRRSELTKRLGLTPDGIVLMPRSGQSPMRTYSMDWVRVIPNRLPTRELERVLSVSSHLGSWVDAFQMVQLDRVILVVDMECDWIVSALRQYLSTHLRPDGTPLNIALVRWTIDTSLMSCGDQEIDAYRLLEGASKAAPCP